MSASPTLRPPEVVCIAASTGGPQAIGAFLDALTGPPPCPVLIIQHLPRSFTGRFADRLHRRSALAVREAGSGEPLRPGEILVAPGDTHLRIRNRRVRLNHLPPVAGLRPRADLTLGDLAAEYGAGATAVVLSGTAVEPPFDLVVCRNVVIYLTADARDRLLERIADWLSDGGALLLGSAERILRPEAFGLTRIAPGLYRRQAVGRQP